MVREGVRCNLQAAGQHCGRSGMGGNWRRVTLGEQAEVGGDAGGTTGTGVAGEEQPSGGYNAGTGGRGVTLLGQEVLE